MPPGLILPAVGVNRGFPTDAAGDRRSGWSGIEGPGRKVWGPSGAAPPPPTSCLTLLGAMSVVESGQQFALRTVTMPTNLTAAAAGMAYAFAVGGYGAAFAGDRPTIAGSGWTNLDSYPTIPGTAVHMIDVVGTKPVLAGAVGNIGFGWSIGYSPGDLEVDALSCIIPTASLAPAQNGRQIGTGAIITLGSSPTVGHLYVCAYAAEVPAGVPLIDQAAVNAAGLGLAWTLLGAAKITDNTSVDAYQMALLFHCVGPGESNTVDVLNGSFRHDNFLSEWPLT